MRTYLGNELMWNSSGKTRPQSPQLAEPLWTDPGVKSEIDAPKLISIPKKKKKKKEKVGNELTKSSHKHLSSEEKAIFTSSTLCSLSYHDIFFVDTERVFLLRVS